MLRIVKNEQCMHSLSKDVRIIITKLCTEGIGANIGMKYQQAISIKSSHTSISPT